MTRFHTSRVVSFDPRDRLFTGIETGTQPLLAEFNGHDNSWILWLAYSANRQAGTRLVLCEDGSIWREVIEPSGKVDRILVAPKQGGRRKPQVK